MYVAKVRTRVIGGFLAVFVGFGTAGFAQQSSTAQAAAGASTRPQPGDQLRITGWPQSAFGAPVQVIVDSRGVVILPQIGDVNVGGISIDALRDTLKTRYARYVRNPEIDVTVLRRVTVNGAVLRPDVYYMDVSATLRDVIARAGGISEVGSRKAVSVVRDGQQMKVPNWETDVSSTSVLRSGDQVLVGRRSWLSINIIPVVSLGLATASFLLSLKK